MTTSLPETIRDLGDIPALPSDAAAAALSIANEFPVGTPIGLETLREKMLEAGVPLAGATLGKRQLQKLFRESAGWIFAGGGVVMKV